jgi:cytochrome P450
MTLENLGHETTSGLLSFLFYLLITHPDAYAMLQQEIDQVVGKGPVKADHLSKLQYVKACIRESLRLYPTAAVWGVSPLLNDSGAEEHVILANKWAIRRNQTVLVFYHQSFIVIVQSSVMMRRNLNQKECLRIGFEHFPKTVGR